MRSSNVQSTNAVRHPIGKGPSISTVSSNSVNSDFFLSVGAEDDFVDGIGAILIGDDVFTVNVSNLKNIQPASGCLNLAEGVYNCSRMVGAGWNTM